MKTSHTRTLFWLSAVLSVATGALGLLTLVWQDWIEAVSSWSPDHGNGSVEAMFVVTLGVVSIAASLVARHARRRLHALPQAV